MTTSSRGHSSLLTQAKQCLYLTTIDLVVISVLVQDDLEVQKSLYYVSHVLSEIEEQYPPIERLAFTLVLAIRKLHPYFQSHIVQVITD